MKKYTTAELNRMPFYKLLSLANNEPMSEAGQFMSDLAGNRYFYKGIEVYKYQLWGMGYKSASAILANKIPEIRYQEKWT